MQVLISVVVATYNRAALLQRAIDSVLSQVFSSPEVSFELIIVDDGSTDNTFEVINPYLQAFTNFNYLKHKNRKQALSLNAGLKLASGQFITFLDSDDQYLPVHLQTHLDYMLANPSFDLVHGGLEIIGNQFVPDKFNTSKMIHLDDCVAGGTIFAKQEVFRQLNGFDTLDYASDSDFVDRAINFGYCVARFHPKTYRYYRDSPDSICNNLLEKTL